MSYAAKTDVPVAKSQAEIQAMLTAAGATRYGSMFDRGPAAIGFTLNARNVRFVLPLPDRSNREFTHSRRGRRTDGAVQAAWEQGCRACWRALKLCIKAKLEAVQLGITTFDEEFLAHIVMADGRTVGQAAIPQLTNGTELLLKAPPAA